MTRLFLYLAALVFAGCVVIPYEAESEFDDLTGVEETVRGLINNKAKKPEVLETLGEPWFQSEKNWYFEFCRDSSTGIFYLIAVGYPYGGYINWDSQKLSPECWDMKLSFDEYDQLMTYEFERSQKR